MNRLNSEATKYGIKFPINEVQFGESINLLDLTVYLEEDKTIHLKGYTKPTDAKRYLNAKSYHPRSVFTSIPYSQMILTIKNNTKDDTRTTERIDGPLKTEATRK